MQPNSSFAFDPLHLDDDTWVDSCHICGTFDNRGDAECARCDMHR